MFLELGTRQHCRNNVTMFSGQKMVDYCRMSKVDVDSPFRHQGLNVFRFFLFLVLYYVVALSLSQS